MLLDESFLRDRARDPGARKASLAEDKTWTGAKAKAKANPSAVAYLNSGEQSFFDEFQKYLYLGGIVLSMAGSAIALLVGHLNRKKSENDLRQIDRLIEFADNGTADSTAFSIAIAHARHAIEKQREALRQRQTGSMPQQEP